jgi:hypothetical protein
MHNEQRNHTNIEYLVPGLPLYYGLGEQFASRLYDFFEYLSGVMSGRKDKI